MEDMEVYLARQLKANKLNYNAVVAKYPEYKEGIDIILFHDGYTINADGTVTPPVTP
jgi:hypothetical protein